MGNRLYGLMTTQNRPEYVWKTRGWGGDNCPIDLRRLTNVHNDHVNWPRRNHRSDRLNQPYHPYTNISVDSSVERCPFSRSQSTEGTHECSAIVHESILPLLWMFSLEHHHLSCRRFHQPRTIPLDQEPSKPFYHRTVGLGVWFFLPVVKPNISWLQPDPDHYDRMLTTLSCRSQSNLNKFKHKRYRSKQFCLVVKYTRMKRTELPAMNDAFTRKIEAVI